MIHPGLIALEKWEPIEYASGYRARLAGIQIRRGLITAGVVVGKTPTLKRSNRIETNECWLRAGKTITQTRGVCCSIPEEMPEQMVFRSMEAEHSHGERDGSQRISI
jgi:hypothetical protein